MPQSGFFFTRQSPWALAPEEESMNLDLNRLLVKTMLEDQLPERRSDKKDRRQLKTYLASDGRSGIADRRVNKSLMMRLARTHL